MKFSYYNKGTDEWGYPMGLEDLMHLLTAPETKRKVDAVRGATNPEEQKKLKKKLPLVLFQSYSVNGRRLKTTCLSNGCVGLDIDEHLADPRQFYEEHIAPLKELLGLRMAYISARGYGLHLVCDLIQGTADIEENITEFTHLLDIECDAVCHDFSRGFFLTTKEDLLYLDESMFTDEPRFVIDNPDFVDPEAKADDDDNDDDDEVSVESGATEATAELTYRGIPYKKIMSNYWETRGGVPMNGERHNEVLRFMHRLKFICDFDTDKMRQVIGNAFGLDDSELRQIIKDVLKFPHTDKMPYDIYRILNRYGVVDDVTEIDANDEGVYPVNDEDIPLDSLPPIVKMFVRIAPKGFATATIYLIMSILGFLFTRLRAIYLNNERHSPTLMMTVEAPMASGKSFATHIYNRMVTKIKEMDDLARQEEKAYETELKRSKNKAKQPEEPKSFIRLIPGRNSVSKFLKRQVKAMCLHLFSFCSEISSVMGNQKSPWADKSSVYRNSFDNDPFGQDYMSDNAASEDVEIYLNFCYCGTPGAVDEMYRHLEDGTSSRLVPCTIPDSFGQDMPVWGKLTRKEENSIDRIQEQAIASTFDENGDIRSEILVDMSWMLPEVEKWLKEQQILSVKNCDRAIDTLRKRSSVIGFRIAVIAYYLFGCRKKSRQMVIEFYRWAATTTLHLQYNRFGEQLNEMFAKRETKKIKLMPTMRSTATLYDSLPEEFTTMDVERCKTAIGLKREARKVISDYVRTGIAQKVAANKWKKVV